MVFLPLRPAEFSNCYQTTVLTCRKDLKKKKLKNKNKQASHKHHSIPMKGKLQVPCSMSGEDLNIMSRPLCPYKFVHEMTEYSTGTFHPNCSDPSPSVSFPTGTHSTKTGRLEPFCLQLLSEAAELALTQHQRAGKETAVSASNFLKIHYLVFKSCYL